MMLEILNREQSQPALPCYQVILKASITAAPIHFSWNVKRVQFRGTRWQCVLSNCAFTLHWCILPSDGDTLTMWCSVAHCPSQQNRWIVHIYGIPLPEQGGILFSRFARLVKAGLFSSGISLVIAMTWRIARAQISNVKSPSRWKHFKIYSIRLICTQIWSSAWHLQHFEVSF